MRRAGAFAEVQECLATLRIDPADEVTTAVVAFQKARTEARDSGRYLMSAALRPPAHAPHVSHGKRPRGGLLSRLFGR